MDEYQNGYALVRIRLKTGRHHQIRVQLAHAGMPIVGDRKYGAEGGELCLCSYELAFHHPQTGKPMQFSLASEPLVEVIRKELFQLAEPDPAFTDFCRVSITFLGCGCRSFALWRGRWPALTGGHMCGLNRKRMRSV
ncbi:MAG: hypothetical protein ACLRVS_03270 [Lachnospiraceae bacterium]